MELFEFRNEAEDGTDEGYTGSDNCYVSFAPVPSLSVNKALNNWDRVAYAAQIRVLTLVSRRVVSLFSPGIDKEYSQVPSPIWE